MALDFPSSPVNGQVYDNFIYNAAKGTWKSISAGASPTVLVNPTITNAVISATSPNATTVPFTVKGAVSQSANLQEWKDNAGITNASVSPGGWITSNGLTSKSSSGATTFVAGDDVSGQIELGRTDGIAGQPYIDFHSGATAVDYDARIQASGGNGSNGNGTLSITADKANFSGKLSISSQPSFSTSMTGGWVWVQPNNVVVFNSPQFNVGGYYNSSNGRFTAPVAGRYFFTFSFYIDGQRQASFRKNGSDYIPSDTVICMTPPATATSAASYLFNLNAGDYIEVGCRSGSTALYFYTGHSWFSGYMVG